MTEADDRPDSRAAFVAIIGAPNAGKSTLVNALVGEKVSIVTHKVQTTRFPVRGVAMVGEAQLVLVDTPGIFRPKRRLDRAMVRSAWQGAADADIVVHLSDARPWAGFIDHGFESPQVEEDQSIIGRLKEENRKAILAINKVDAIERERLLSVAQRLFAEGVYSEVFMISSLTGSGVPALAERLASLAPVGPHFFPDDQTADVPVRLLAAEITREKLLLRLHQELPYQLTVETESWKELPGQKGVRVEQVIHVAREAHRKIILGRQGQTIRDIGTAARKELTDVLGRPAHLFLRVKVTENWGESREHFSAIGLDFDV